MRVAKILGREKNSNLQRKVIFEKKVSFKKPCLVLKEVRLFQMDRHMRSTWQTFLALRERKKIHPKKVPSFQGTYGLKSAKRPPKREVTFTAHTKK